jgi:MFS family permease
VTLFIIVGLAFLTHVGFAGSRLAVPLFANDQGASPFVIGTIVALYAALPAALAVVAGRMIDRFGYRVPLTFGTSAVFAALMIPFVWPKLPALYFTACLLGVGFMALQLATQTLAGAIAGPDERSRNFSWLSIGFAGANLTGPFLTGVFIDHIGYSYTFCAIAMPLVPAILISSFAKRWIPPTAQKKSEPVSGGFFDLLRIRDLRNTLIASGIVSSAWDVYQFFMPLYGRSQGLSATAIGTIMSAFAISIILLRIVLPWAVRRSSEARLLTYAMFVACAAFCLFPLFHDPWALGAVSFLLGIGCGCGQPLSMTLVFNASPKGRAGEATGMRITVNQLTHMTIPLLFGAIGSAVGLSAVFVANAGFLIVGGYMSWRNHAQPVAA